VTAETQELPRRNASGELRRRKTKLKERETMRRKEMWRSSIIDQRVEKNSKSEEDG